MNHMTCYLVGGAVRDALLNKPIKERDWVVVGSDAATLLSQGYQPVGKDFPVFLHPKTKEEYALARTERKQGHGYKGFTFYADPSITLIQDLMRRDLTINAMAQDEAGQIIDPFDGQDDLKKKILRHVSDAFSEDPVRVLRAARFSAQLSGFKIHSSTKQEIEKIIQSGELDYLTPERDWNECFKALNQKESDQFFVTLEALKAHSVLFPEYPYRSIQIETLRYAKDSDALIRFACWSSHESEEAIIQLCKRLNIPRSYRQLARISSFYSINDARINNMSSEDWMACFNRVDLWRQPVQFQAWLRVMQYKALAEGQTLRAPDDLYSMAKKLLSMQVDQEMMARYQGPALGAALAKKRKEAVSEWIKKHT
jgi:tRNA nucleotidyltransferase (CCA-adding enzyme)